MGTQLVSIPLLILMLQAQAEGAKDRLEKELRTAKQRVADLELQVGKHAAGTCTELFYAWWMAGEAATRGGQVAGPP